MEARWPLHNLVRLCSAGQDMQKRYERFGSNRLLRPYLDFISEYHQDSMSAVERTAVPAETPAVAIPNHSVAAGT